MWVLNTKKNYLLGIVALAAQRQFPSLSSQLKVHCPFLHERKIGTTPPPLAILEPIPLITHH
jgi:hypothetical protein